MFRKLLFSVTEERSIAAELVMTALRVFFGLAMAYSHGLGKVPPTSKFIGRVAEMGFPSPELFAWAAGLSELVGGLLVAAGLLTRAGALAVCVTMAVAAFVRHGADPFADKEFALLYLAVGLVFLVRGAGAWSLDRLISGRK